MSPSPLTPRLVLCAFLLALCMLPSLADLTLGADARAIGMGGAGLASGDSPDAATLNPASLAQTGVRLGILWPTANARMDGAGLGDVLDLLGSANLSVDEALDLVRTLGDEPTEIAASGSAGVLLPYSDIRAAVSLRTRLEPSPAFQQWVRTGMTVIPADPSDISADVYAAGLAHLPSIGAGAYLPVNAGTVGRIAVGVRVKPTQAYYSHYQFRMNSETMALEQVPAAEMNGQDYLKASSLSADAGMLYTPARYPRVRLALVVNNLIEPKSIELGNGFVSKQVSPRTFSVGSALVYRRFTLAADVIDLTDAHGEGAQLRVGSEVRLPLGVALRAGYNTHNGFTGGLGLGGFGIAYSGDTPVMLSETLTF